MYSRRFYDIKAPMGFRNDAALVPGYLRPWTSGHRNVAGRSSSVHRPADLVAANLPGRGRDFNSCAVLPPALIPAEKAVKNPSTMLRMKIFFMPSVDEALTAIVRPVTLLAYTLFCRRTG